MFHDMFVEGTNRRLVERKMMSPNFVMILDLKSNVFLIFLDICLDLYISKQTFSDNHKILFGPFIMSIYTIIIYLYIVL